MKYMINGKPQAGQSCEEVEAMAYTPEQLRQFNQGLARAVSIHAGDFPAWVADANGVPWFIRQF